MNRREYRDEKSRIIRILIGIATIITVFSIVINIYIYRVSGVSVYIDIVLLLVLALLLLFYEKIMDSKIYRFLIFALFPLVYFPLGWIAGSGLAGVGVLYFFVFSIAIIYMNPNRSGLFASFLLIAEIMIMILLERYQILIYKEVDVSVRSNLYLFHFPIASIGYSLSYYYTARKHVVLSERIYATSLKDYLTKAFNRQYLMEYIEDIYLETSTTDDVFFLIFFDINNFKRINDTYGHEMGDNVLILFSRCVSTIIRKDDIFGRYGGDEFILVVRDTSNENVAKLKKRIKQSFAKLCRKELGFEISLSVGIESSEGNTVKDLIKFADEKMYKDKTQVQ